jgi:hypothetical protein
VRTDDPAADKLTVDMPNDRFQRRALARLALATAAAAIALELPVVGNPEQQIAADAARPGAPYQPHDPLA